MKLGGIQRINSRPTPHFIEEKPEAQRCQWQNLELPKDSSQAPAPKGEVLVANCPSDLTIFARHYHLFGPIRIKWVIFASLFSSGLLFIPGCLSHLSF